MGDSEYRAYEAGFQEGRKVGWRIGQREAFEKALDVFGTLGTTQAMLRWLMRKVEEADSGSGRWPSAEDS
jgi:hypothetical protein